LPILPGVALLVSAVDVTVRADSAPDVGSVVVAGAAPVLFVRLGGVVPLSRGVGGFGSVGSPASLAATLVLGIPAGADSGVAVTEWWSGVTAAVPSRGEVGADRTIWGVSPVSSGAAPDEPSGPSRWGAGRRAAGGFDRFSCPSATCTTLPGGGHQAGGSVLSHRGPTLCGCLATTTAAARAATPSRSAGRCGRPPIRPPARRVMPTPSNCCPLSPSWAAGVAPRRLLRPAAGAVAVGVVAAGEVTLRYGNCAGCDRSAKDA
jgi:hypothetical protein